ncbi:MAG: hypothetical protein OXH09_23010 [Gammaproteobacteria bacterium]|nr:hypothetical protein [Gammaproteobacteria bacterium]
MYRVVPDTGIDVFAVEDGGLTHEETKQVGGLKDAVIAPSGDFVYAARLGPCDTRGCQLDATSQLRTFRRDQESGLLALQNRYLYYYNVDDVDSLSISDDERLFVTRKSSGYTLLYELVAGVLTRAGTSVSLLSDADVSIQLARPFEFTSARPGTAAVDVFGTDTAVGFEIPLGEVDVLANGQTDRFGNRLPLFGAPNGLAASPDARHVYVSSYQHGVVAFERVGAGVEPGDPYTRLDILEVSSGSISFGAEEDSDGCIAVDDLAYDGVAYTVRSSKWQRRPNADWPWADVAGTAKTGEVCPHTPEEPGHYRLVVEMEVDGETRQHASNVHVEDDHGDSIDDATAVGVPSLTDGWLDPGDEDYFRIDLDRSGELTAHSEWWINAEGRLLDEDGDLITSASGGAAADFNFRIVRDLDAGTYFVRIHERFSRAGAYTIHVGFEVHTSDLVVEAVSVSDTSPDSGASFTLNRFLVVDSADDKVYAYGRSGERDASSDFDLAFANGAPRGIAATDDRLYVVDYWDEKVYVYRTTGERDASSDFDLAFPNSHPAGMTHADGALYVLDSSDDRAYAYGTSGERQVDNEFDLNASNSSPTGMAHRNGSFFVVDSAADQVFVYSGGAANSP